MCYKSLSVRTCNRGKTLLTYMEQEAYAFAFSRAYRTAIVISPASNAEMINSIVLCGYSSILVFDAREGICDVIGVL